MNFNINKSYSFKTLAPSVLGASFKNFKCLGIFDYNTAAQYINPNERHAQIYPLLPAGTSNDPTTYTYLLFQSPSGVKTVLALEWIDSASVSLLTYSSLAITVPNAGSADVKKIRDMLVIMGYSGISIAVQTS
jgi:hypothetical protein